MSKEFDVVVVGSIFMDLIAYSERLPNPGETIQGSDFKTGFGGKGANQCVAAQRVGAKTAFVGKLGHDPNGELYFQHFKDEGVNVDGIGLVEDKSIPSGVASILVGADNGQNLIVIVAGATGLMSSAYVESATVEAIISKSKILLCQLEVPVDCTHSALKLAKKLGNVTTIFNAAPGLKNLPLEIFQLTDILCVNESEAEIITGIPRISNEKEARQATQELIEKFECNSVIVTLGSAGALVWDKKVHKFEFINAPNVSPVVDTTGAGDCFLGTLAYCLSKGDSLIDASRKAVRNASDSVLRKGTQSSFPRTILQ